MKALAAATSLAILASTALADSHSTTRTTRSTTTSSDGTTTTTTTTTTSSSTATGGGMTVVLPDRPVVVAPRPTPVEPTYDGDDDVEPVEDIAVGFSSIRTAATGTGLEIAYEVDASWWDWIGENGKKLVFHVGAKKKRVTRAAGTIAFPGRKTGELWISLDNQAVDLSVNGTRWSRLPLVVRYDWAGETQVIDACGGRAECLAQVRSVAFDPTAAITACAKISYNGEVVDNCVAAAVRGDVDTSAVVGACQQISYNTDVVVECVRDAAPAAVEMSRVIGACQQISYNSEVVLGCVTRAAGSRYDMTQAIGACQQISYSSDSVLDCIGRAAPAGRDPSAAIKACAGQSYDTSVVLGCIGQSVSAQRR